MSSRSDEERKIDERERNGNDTFNDKNSSGGLFTKKRMGAENIMSLPLHFRVECAQQGTLPQILQKDGML